MNDHMFNHAIALVLILDESGCLKQGANPDKKNDQNSDSKQCNGQIKAIILTNEYLSKLVPEQAELAELDGALKPEAHQCPHCGAHNIQTK
jgi:hypothetical protein